MSENRSDRTKKIATFLTPDQHRAFGVLLKLDGGRTMDEFLRSAIESYICDHRFAGSVAHLIKQDTQDDQEAPH